MVNFCRTKHSNFPDAKVYCDAARCVAHWLLGVDPGRHRAEWFEYIINGPEWTVELKASACIQSWKQTRSPRISLKIEKHKRTWLVFALLVEHDCSHLNPEGLSQWRLGLVTTVELLKQVLIGLVALILGVGSGLTLVGVCSLNNGLACEEVG